MSTVAVQVRMDEELKQASELLFKSMGLNMSSAINLFCTQTVNQGKLPFAVVPAIPAETLLAIQETNDIIAHPEKYQGYTDINKLMDDLDA